MEEIVHGKVPSTSLLLLPDILLTSYRCISVGVSVFCLFLNILGNQRDHGFSPLNAAFSNRQIKHDL